ncbi:ParB/RepB/Spo0J family partition protein [Streptomyces bambusae]|uniref:ParB/RepB/Spo0J family partition protein n=1 Tax=Streptomyces bambusae TaxID=1550616 RepID=UPI001CFE420C|nr:ParB/RepB/Spo0J family partition protein [Streptomyces bambusae]MCB5166541.1 ParB/RepB/Spo0J family partition protein [Streptomyces bambusae]
MSKSDLLGTGSAFATARRSGGRSERGRAKAIAQGDLPAYELVRIALDRVSPTPLNPRRNFGSDEEMARFGEELREAQLAACVAVSRSAYLALWPEHETGVGDAEYVLINGERRYRCALAVGLEALDFVVRDDLAGTREDFFDHLLSENLDREDFNVIERARGVAQLVDFCAEERLHGAKSRAAERMGKSPGWVTQQLALLELPEAIQRLLITGELPERDGRFLTRAAKDNPALAPEELIGLLQQSKAEEARKKQQEREILAAHTAEGSEPPAGPFTAVKVPAVSQTSESAAAPASSEPADHLEQPGASGERSLPTQDAAVAVDVPEPRMPSLPAGTPDPETAYAEDAAPSDDNQHSPYMVDVRKMPRVPWHDGKAVAQLVLQKMPDHQRTVLLEVLLEAHGTD